MTQNRRSSDTITFAHFQKELDHLVEQFGRNLGHCKSSAFDEASLRNEYLNPFFRALGWDVENRAGFIPQHREVEIESRTEIAGRKKRADYLFRTDRVDRFVCEAKKPAEELHAGYAYQAKRYAWNKGLVLAMLSDFEEMKIYVVGSKPNPEELNVGLWKSWHFQQYPQIAQEIWDLLSRPAVADGSIDKLIEQLPKKPTGKGKARQQWLFKPDRTRSLDTDFLNFLDEARRGLASDLLANNDRDYLLEGDRLNEATQHILDRLLFLRICEDRGIDTGHSLALIIKSWRGRTDNPPKRKPRQTELSIAEERAELHPKAKESLHYSLWRDVVSHFRALDRRPPSSIPYFNGNLFKPHFSEELEVSDEWLPGFLDDMGDDESPYLFNVIPVEILGTIYERFLGKVVRPKGRGVLIEEKPEVRKAGGVYYTPRYIVDYIVEQTVGKLLEYTTPKDSLKLRILDPACGSGSFLIRAYERVCEHWQTAFMKDEKLRRNRDCWIDPVTKDIHLTTDLKRRILTANIYGVDIDPGAVEVTQLSLYLKMLEGENRTTMARERDIFGSDIALLPPLQDNIKNGNSLIASDFSMITEDIVRVKAFDWPVQFPNIIKTGGFDAVIGNPPYIRPHKMESEMKEYFWRTLVTFVAKSDIYSCFMERGLSLLKEDGIFSFIVPHTWTSLESFESIRRKLILETEVLQLVQLPKKVFQDATVETCIFSVQKKAGGPSKTHKINILRIGVNQKTQEVRTFPQKDISESHLHNFQLYTDNKTTDMAGRFNKITKPLGDFVEFLYGFKTADDNKFIQADRRYKDSKPFIRSAGIYRYWHEKPSEFVWYVPEKMKENKSTARPGEKERFEAKKILVARMGKHLIASYDSEGLYVKDAMLLLAKRGSSQSLKYLLALINSRLLDYYYREYYVTIDVLKNALLALPIRPIDLHKHEESSLRDRVIALTDKMLGLVPKLRETNNDTEKATIQNAITATDRQIDALVYELYGLTKEEIELVEKS